MKFSSVCFALGNGLVALASASPDLDLILYGADGCVGHFAASHLAQQPNLKWAIAGRTKAHLQTVADQLAKEGGSSSKPEIIVAALDNTTDPKTWVTRAKAVVSAAGPFSVHGGEVLLKACAENGVHYSDTSDEFYWQRWMIDRHNDAAVKSGARIVLSSGFCVLPGDLGSQLAIGALGAGGQGEISIDAWLEEYNGGLSAGVINTGKAIIKAKFPKEWNEDPYVLVPDADPSQRLDTKVEGMSYPRWVSGEGLVISNLFGPYDARLLRRSYLHQGQKVHLRVGAYSPMYAKWTAFLASHPGSWTNLTKCPSQKVYDDGSWAYRVKATGSDGNSKTVLLSGKGDPGYRFTSWGLAEAGLCLSGKTEGCFKSNGAGGVFTSMSAMEPDVLSKRLQSVDLMKVEMVTEEQQGEQEVVV